MRTGQIFRQYIELRDARHVRWIDCATGVASARYTEPISCPLCQSDTYRVWFVKRGFRWVRCRRCGMVYVNPRLSDEARLMSYCGDDAQFYYTHCAPTDQSEDGWQEELTRIHDYRNPGRLLDIACGSGHFLYCAQQAGWDVSGVEMNPVAVALARQSYGIHVETGTFESTTFSDGSFDVVSIFQALDQLADPLGALRRMRRLLVPGGLLVLTVPNIRSFIVWALGSRHRHFTPEKDVSFTPRTLRQMVRQSGFDQIIQLRTFGEECTLSNLLDLVRTRFAMDLFEHRASRNGSSAGLRKGKLLRAPRRSLSNLLIALTRLAGLGSYMTLYARSRSRRDRQQCT